ncbi:hypothetical protein AMECASPLE_021499 [Ameca splendens]|uniref:Uncharacterized protein n=1 Tax=Ameca splendens TaxID=208324 RepID=A0ABV0XGK3_9TELE
MLLQEIEEAEGCRSTAVSPVSIPGGIRSSLPSTASATSASPRRHRIRRKPSSSLTATAASPEPFMTWLFSPELVGGYPVPSAGPRSSVRPPVPAWVQAWLEEAKKDL